MKKLITIVALTASVLASPAFAQSFNPSDGTGNELPFSYGPGATKQRWTVVAPQTNQIAGRQSGLDAYAMAPGASSAADTYSPGTY